MERATRAARWNVGAARVFSLSRPTPTRSQLGTQANSFWNYKNLELLLIVGEEFPFFFWSGIREVTKCIVLVKEVASNITGV